MNGSTFLRLMTSHSALRVACHVFADRTTIDHEICNVRYETVRSLLLALVLALLSAGSLHAQSTPTLQPAPSLHPTFPLLDADGEHVLVSGRPVSTMQTCGTCHDAAYIARHSFHGNLGLDALVTPEHVPGGAHHGSSTVSESVTYRFFTPAGAALDTSTLRAMRRLAARHVGGGAADAATLTPAWSWLDGEVVESNCFLCHTPAPNNEARLDALADGAFAWANTATLLGSGLVDREGDTWRWNADAFDADQHVVAGFLRVQDPTDANCANCHGAVHPDPDVPFTLGDPGRLPMTMTTGVVFSPQRLAESGLNLADKAVLSRSWDVHAERLVECVDCHYSVNNPIYFREPEASQPSHLAFDPRRQDITEYLYRPSHVLARGAHGAPEQASGATATMRRCSSCHEPEATHQWLPYRQRHLDAVSCETCHVPRLYAPAAQSIDWTVLDLTGEPLTEYRGVEDGRASATSLVTAYEPVLLPREDGDGGTRLTPYNLVTSTYWIDGATDQPVARPLLERAFLQDGDYHATVLAALDADGDGQLSPEEQRLDTPAKVDAVRARLADVGVTTPQIRSVVQPYSLHHGVTHGDWVMQDCQTCHATNSRLAQPITLAAHLPAGVEPVLAASHDIRLSGRIETSGDGHTILRPSTRSAGLYVLGHDRTAWVDLLGLAAVVLVLLGIALHGGFRVITKRRGRRNGYAAPTRPAYMYSFYERFWHWLQAVTIMGLLFTGLGVHWPLLIVGADYGLVVWVHNILGFILVANALLAAFYHFASGEVRQFLPEPRGFFSEAIAQLVYYGRGMFRGDPHPFEKHPDKKLNPLQQITYLALLNILIPLQIVTGILIWGAQRWPALAEGLGGLGFLAPLHTLIAWLLGAFLLMHVYLTTTGRTPTTHLKAMVVGWEDVEVHEHEVA